MTCNDTQINLMKIDVPLDCQQTGLRQLWQEAFGDSGEFLDTFWRTAFSPDRCRCVTINGQVAAALYWFNCHRNVCITDLGNNDTKKSVTANIPEATKKPVNTDTPAFGAIAINKPIAYIYAVATARKYQGQGLCHTLIANTHAHLAGLGYEGAVLVPGSKELFRLYEDMGYKNCACVKEFECMATDNLDSNSIMTSPAVCSELQYKKKPFLRSISRSEYAKLRRMFLPENSIIQEHENLAFLETYATLYAGADFLLACHGEGDTLHGIELLGNTNKAPGIVKELGYKKGAFRTVGNERPFAMYYSFNNGSFTPPAYFGLAFD